MAPRALRHKSEENYFLFALPESLRAFGKCLFTREAATANGRCICGALQMLFHRKGRDGKDQRSNFLRLASARQLPQGESLILWRSTSQTTPKASLPEGGGTAQAVTEGVPSQPSLRDASS